MGLTQEEFLQGRLDKLPKPQPGVDSRLRSSLQAQLDGLRRAREEGLPPAGPETYRVSLVPRAKAKQ